MTPTATPGKAEDSDAAGTHALTREQRCGARQAWQSADLQRWRQALQQEYDEQGAPCPNAIARIVKIIFLA